MDESPQRGLIEEINSWKISWQTSTTLFSSSFKDEVEEEEDDEAAASCEEGWRSCEAKRKRFSQLVEGLDEEEEVEEEVVVEQETDGRRFKIVWKNKFLKLKSFPSIAQFSVSWRITDKPTMEELPTRAG
jgi:hypothetical protein